jgi:hypothetical protein
MLCGGVALLGFVVLYFKRRVFLNSHSATRSKKVW